MKGQITYRNVPYTGRATKAYRGLMKHVGIALKAGHQVDFAYATMPCPNTGHVFGHITVTITRGEPE